MVADDGEWWLNTQTNSEYWLRIVRSLMLLIVPNYFQSISKWSISEFVGGIINYRETCLILCLQHTNDLWLIIMICGSSSPDLLRMFSPNEEVLVNFQTTTFLARASDAPPRIPFPTWSPAPAFGTSFRRARRIPAGPSFLDRVGWVFDNQASWHGASTSQHWEVL